MYTVLGDMDDDFEWDEGNVGHIARRGLEPVDVEEALLDPDGYPAPAYNAGEVRKAFIGATEAGRLLYVVYVVRYGKTRVVTARDANKGEKRRYRR
jgi:uncharacterized DUF497 family protein